MSTIGMSIHPCYDNCKGLYDETVIFGFEEDYVVFPIVMFTMILPGCKLESLVLPEDAGLYTDVMRRRYVSSMSAKNATTCWNYFRWQDSHTSGKIEKDSWRLQFSVALFWKKLSNKYNSFRDLKDWRVCFPNQDIELETLFPCFRSISPWENCCIIIPGSWWIP
jgi:hypothetical protein